MLEILAAFVGVLILVGDIYALIQTLGSNASGFAKGIWSLVILFLPLLGLIAWFAAGPRSVRY
jgi:hypothetical protein